MATPTLVSRFGGGSSGTGVTVTLSSILEDDYLVAVCSSYYSADGESATAGWTQEIERRNTAASNAGAYRIYTLTAGASPPTSFTFTGPDNYNSVIIFQFRGADSIVIASTDTQDTTTTVTDPPAIDAGSSQDLYVVTGSAGRSALVSGIPSGYGSEYSADNSGMSSGGGETSLSAQNAVTKTVTAQTEDPAAWTTGQKLKNLYTFAVWSSVVVTEGTASGSLAFTGDAAGEVKTNGAASGTLAFTGAGAGEVAVQGTAAGSLAFTGDAAGGVAVSGSGTGDLDFTGASTGGVAVEGTAAGSLDFTGSAAGGSQVSGTGSGSFDFSGSSAGEVAITGAGSGALDFTGTSAGQVFTVTAGTGAGAIAFVGSAEGALLTTYFGVSRSGGGGSRRTTGTTYITRTGTSRGARMTARGRR